MTQTYKLNVLVWIKRKQKLLMLSTAEFCFPYIYVYTILYIYYINICIICIYMYYIYIIYIKNFREFAENSKNNSRFTYCIDLEIR